MISPFPNPYITDGDRFRAMFSDPVTATERCEQIAHEVGINLSDVPPAQVLDCMRVLCDRLIQESSLSV